MLRQSVPLFLAAISIVACRDRGPEPQPPAAPLVLDQAKSVEPRAVEPETRLPAADVRIDPVALLPADPIAVGGLDLAALSTSRVWSEAHAAMGKEEFFRVLEMADRCGAGMGNIESLHGAVTQTNGNEPLVLLRGDAIARVDAAYCLFDEVQAQRKRDGAAPLPAPREADITRGTVLDLEDKKTRIYVLPKDDLLAIVPYAEDVAFLDRVEGRGPTILDGDWAEPIARAQSGDTLWFVVRPNPTTGGTVEKVVEIIGHADATSGLRADVELRYASPAEADSALAEIREMWVSMQSFATYLNIPQSAVSRVRIDQHQSTVRVDASLTELELEALWTARKNGPSQLDPAADSRPPPVDSPLL